MKTRAMVYDTQINGKTMECLFKVVAMNTEEDFERILKETIKATGKKLRYIEDFELPY